VEVTPGYRKILSGEAQGAGAACLRLALALLSIPYGLAVRFRNWLYDVGLRAEHRVDKPVICIGNITTGGTGKTPAVEYVVRWFAEQGARPAIVSRGYRSQGEGNDEAMLLAQRLPGIPHRQHPNRFRAAIEAMKLDNANVLVLDDGFQHRRLARFANVVLIDATCPFGFGHLLPRGLLREPLAGLSRADAVVITRADLADEGTLLKLTERIRKFAPAAPIATARHAPTAVRAYPNGAPQPPGILAGKNVGLFCSIGNPAAFRQTARQLGANVLWSAEFSDHHWYTQEDIAAITRAENTAVELFVTTEKDAVKLGGKWPVDRKLVVLRIEMEILSGEDGLTGLFREALKAAQYGEE
jgi:tetraacyldisaccharide 4'-kinase